MYEVNGICFVGEKNDSIKVVAAKFIADKILLVKFSTGEMRLFDAAKLTGNAFNPLKNQEVFQAFEVQHGVLTWDHGEIDIAPEYVYEESTPYKPE